jgi:putative peptidoglycan lipid II flippase
MTEEDWGEPSLYTRGARPVEPRTFTEADPISTVLVADDRPGAADARWGSVTYVGRPRRGAKQAQAAVSTPEETSGTLEAVEAPAAAAAEAVDRDEGTRSVLANSRSMAFASLTSRVTGFLRSIVIVAALGRQEVGNAYNGGNTLPNMIYELLLGGVLSSVLIPLLVHAEDSDEDRGVAYTQRLLSIATAALGVFTLAAVAAAPLLAGAFVPAGSQRELTTVFATLLLPEIFFYGLGAMFMAVLNIRHSYAPGAWSPVLNNAVMILTVLVFWLLPGPKTLNPSTITTPQVLVIGIGTTLGIAAQALVLIPYLRRTGFHWQWRFRARPNEVGRMREVGNLAGWVLVSVIQRIGFHNGGLTVYTYVDLLFQVPYGILVVSLLTAIMPRLSRAAVREDDEAVKADLTLGARLSAIGMVPITAGLIVLGGPLCVTLFAHGQTSLSDARLFGSALAWSAFGLFPFAVVMLQLRVFYAMRDGRTPAIINVFMVATKVLLILVTNAIFTVPHGVDADRHPNVHAVQWLNIATSVSYIVGAVVGHVLLTRRLGLLGFRAVAGTVIRVAIPSALGAGAAYAMVRFCEHTLGHGRAGAVTSLLAGGAVGLAVLAVVAWRMRMPEFRDLRGLVRGG